MRRPTMDQIIFLAVAGVVIFVVGSFAVVWFAPKFAPKWIARLVHGASGYALAQTPEECVEGFMKAMKNRDYNVACEYYLMGEYREMMGSCAEEAQKLGKAIDKVSGQMKVKDHDSQRVQMLLAIMEPFPTEFEWVNTRVTKSGDKAQGAFNESKKFTITELAGWERLQVDMSFYRALAPVIFDPRAANVTQMALTEANARFIVELTGEGKEKGWRLDFPGIRNKIQPRCSSLRQKYKTYLKILESIQDRLRTEPMTKVQLEEAFRQELQDQHQRGD